MSGCTVVGVLGVSSTVEEAGVVGGSWRGGELERRGVGIGDAHKIYIGLANILGK